jgi:hypothetical protein
MTFSVTPIHKDSRAEAANGEPPGGGEMDNRLTKLETRWETVIPTLATKTDIAETKTAIAAAESGVVKWISGIVVAVGSIGVAVTLFAFNRISPPQSPPQAQPIIVYPAAQQIPAPTPPAPQSPPATKPGR